MKTNKLITLVVSNWAPSRMMIRRFSCFTTWLTDRCDDGGSYWSSSSSTFLFRPIMRMRVLITVRKGQTWKTGGSEVQKPHLWRMNANTVQVFNSPIRRFIKEIGDVDIKLNNWDVYSKIKDRMIIILTSFILYFTKKERIKHQRKTHVSKNFWILISEWISFPLHFSLKKLITNQISI